MPTLRCSHKTFPLLTMAHATGRPAAENAASPPPTQQTLTRYELPSDSEQAQQRDDQLAQRLRDLGIDPDLE